MSEKDDGEPPLELVPVEGKELEFTIDDTDGAQYKITFF